MMIFSNQNRKGFTLIETLVAILIFSASLISLMTIAGRGIRATNTAREQITAHYLAQEGLEVARNMRDTNFLQSQLSWDAGISSCTQTTPCQVLYGLGQSVPVLVPCSYACRVGEQGGFFVDAATGNLSPYTREVYAVPGWSDEDGSIHEYRIVSEVSWDSRGIQRSIILQTLIKRWQ